jgi:ligand-binding sensor domain-containing protein/signal transduction histidine kinase
MNKRIFIVTMQAVAMLAAGTPWLGAGEYSHRIWRAEDGLPRNRIQAIDQTPDGYLWIGTSGGLARFDGVRFVVFDSSNTPALHDESITSLWPAHDGSLWAGTEGGGLLHYQNGSFTSFGTAEGLTNGFVRSVLEDKAGNIWVGTDRGFFQLVGDRFVRLDHGTPESPFTSVVQIAFDKQGRIWVGAQIGLLTVVNGMLVPATCRGEPVSAAVKGLYQSSDGRVFSIDAEGFSEVQDGCRRRNPLARDVTVSALREGRDGKLWVGTPGEGLIRYMGGKAQMLTAPSLLPDNAVTAVFEDREQNLWVGSQDGLVLLGKTALTMIGAAEGLADDHITTISAGRRDAAGKDELWVATWPGQIYKISGDKPVAVRLPGVNLRMLKPHTMLEDSKGSLWLGSNTEGVARVDNGADRGAPTRFSMKEGMRSNDVRQIYEDEEGHIWFATGSGMSRWDGKEIRNYYLDDGLSYPSTRCIAPNPGGGMLIGTDEGLNLFQHDRFVAVPAFAALRQDKIWAILADPDGTLWLGTRGGGLIRVRNGRIARYTKREGLPGNAIFQILDDGKGKLWISSPAGISSVLRQELETPGGNPGTLHAVPYGTIDGMLTSQMFGGGAQPAGARSVSGELWFPSLKGVVRINPSALPARESMPVVIEQVVAGDRPMPLSGNIVIQPGQGKLEIDYTACNLAAPQRLSFQYKLEGFDDHWVTALRNRSAYYTNLPPRKYRFVVMATDAASPLHTTEATVDLDLRPSFYQTAWFSGLCGISFVLCIFGGSRIYARQTKSRYALLLAERTRLAREMHDTVIQGCVGVSTLLEAASRSQISRPAEARALVDQAKEHVRTTLEEARQAVWDLRSPVAGDFGVSSLIDLAQRLGTEKAIHVDTEVTGNRSAQDPELDRTLLLVGREALRNAVAHGHPSRIGIRVAFRALDVELEVKDNGVGFDPGATASDGKGHFGIVGMRERVERLGGYFTMNGAAGSGMTVIARIPLGRGGKLAASERHGAN